jgi:hypothetical protein
MKNSKSLLVIIALCSISSLNARKVGQGATSTSQPTVSTPSSQQSIPLPTPPGQKKSFKQFVDYVKTAQGVWDSKNNLLASSFVQKLCDDAFASDMTDFQLDFLLQVARDYHAQFAGNSNDSRTLRALEQQRTNEINYFKSR